MGRGWRLRGIDGFCCRDEENGDAVSEFEKTVYEKRTPAGDWGARNKDATDREVEVRIPSRRKCGQY